MKFNFCSGVTLSFGQYEPALKLNFYSALSSIVAIALSAFIFHSGSCYEI
jgi:hypothetical protein